jgi:hypothetical protein
LSILDYTMMKRVVSKTKWQRQTHFYEGSLMTY